MKQKTKPFAILIFGAPKSGKTYLAEQLSTKYHTLFLDFSTFNRKYKIKSEDIQHFLNNSAFKTKRNVIIEGCLDTEKDRSNIRNACRDSGYIPVLFWVQTDVATINVKVRLPLGSSKLNIKISKPHLHTNIMLQFLVNSPLKFNVASY